MKPVIDGEFDPGSERTLAAWIRHASRAICRKTESGERVRNTWGTYPLAGDNIAKAVLIPDDLKGPHGSLGKDGLDRKVAIVRGEPRAPSASW